MSTERTTPRRRAGFPASKKTLALSLALGAATGAWLASRNRPPAANVDADALPGERAPMMDWEQARGIAVAMNRGGAMTLPERTRLDAYYRALVARCVPIVAAYTGDALPPTAAERTYAFDRVDWVNANIAGFEHLFAPLEGLNPNTGTSAAAVIWGGANQKVVSAELGVMLGYLARRVLGQYDLALLGREPVGTGKLYYVEPNIAQVEKQLGLPGDDFRMWLALHETTHAFEFEAHPWLREHFNDLLEQYFAYLRQDAERLRAEGVRGLGMFVDRVRSGDRGEGSWFETLMTPEQRALFSRLQATMCVVEGYSNHVMNAVGKDLLPTYALISRKFEQRQRERSAAEQLFNRLTGLDVKMSQYRLGEAFVNRVVEARGHDFARRVWDGPESLPSMEEIRHPEQWLARIDATDAIAARAD